MAGAQTASRRATTAHDARHQLLATGGYALICALLKVYTNKMLPIRLGWPSSA